MAFEFVILKPLGKSPSGYLLPVAIALALENGVIKVLDIYGNPFFDIVVGKDIL